MSEERWYERGVAVGDRILSNLEDTPNGRHYWAEDLEGHRWMFTPLPG